MLNRSVPLVVCLSFLSATAFAQSPQGVGYAVQFTSTASGQFQVFAENSSTFPTFSAGNTGPAAPIRIVAKPDGSQFYVVGSSALDSFDPAFKTATPINGLAGTLSGEVISPDGRFLLVEASQGSNSGMVYVVNTSTNSVVLTVPIGGAVVGAAVSQDASTAWVLGESSGTFITTISLTNLAQVGTPIFLRDPTSGNSLGGDATSFSLSPLNLLYVTAGNQVLQIDPTVLATCQASALTCSPTTVISVPATPGPLAYTYAPTTPGGPLYAYFVNQTPQIGGQSLFRIQLPWSAGDGYISYASSEVFDSILIAGSERIFAHSPADTTLWDVAYDLSSVAVSSLQSVLPATTVYSAAITDELPSAQYLFALSGGASLANMYLINLTSNSVSGQASSSVGLGPTQFIYVPSQSPTGFSSPLTYNFTQPDLSPSAVAAPLIARILDQNGNPVYGVPVTFTDPSGTLTLNPVKTTTNANGYVETTVTTGSNPGVFPVTMTATSGGNSVTATFNLTVPGAGSPGSPGTPTGTNQLSIVMGNGQLYEGNVVRIGNPESVLTVQLVDIHGNPLPNQPVTFAVTGPLVGAIDNPNAVTDVNGMAGTDFFPALPPENTPFLATTVTASATNAAGTLIGSVVFTETVYQNDSDGTGEPTVLIQQPTNTFEIQGGEGDVLPDAVQAVIVSNSFGNAQPIPNVSIRITDPSTTTAPGPGTCQGNPLSDQTGTVKCNFIPACATALSASGTPLGLGLHGFSIDVGEYETFDNYGVIITPGTTQAITASTGNNQTGNAGTSIALAAAVTDNCGTGITGVTVTWQVTEGSGTLSSTSSVTAAGGLANTKVTLGAGSGTVTITASINATTSATFTETVNATVGSLTLVSGNSQTATQGSTFSQPLVFALKDNKGNSLSGYTVTFSIASGSASISATSAVTNSLGQVSVNVTAGNTAGAVTINATYSSFTASASLTVNGIGPNVSSTSFVNAASFQTGLAPCGLTTVTGSGLAAGVTGVVSGNTLGIGPLPYTLEGVSITVDSLSAPILSVSNQNGTQQVNFQTPCEIPTGSPATVVVEVNSATTTVPGVLVYQALPGIFTYAGPSGVNYAAVISQQNGGYLTPSNLAQPGGTYYLVATGLGQTAPAAVTNAPGTGETISVSNVTLAINNVGVPVTSVQYLQGAVGEYIITFTIPSTANGQPFPSGTNLPVTLGVVTSSGQTIYDNSPVDLPGIQ